MLIKPSRQRTDLLREGEAGSEERRATQTGQPASPANQFGGDKTIQRPSHKGCLMTHHFVATISPGDGNNASDSSHRVHPPRGAPTARASPSTARRTRRSSTPPRLLPRQPAVSPYPASSSNAMSANSFIIPGEITTVTFLSNRPIDGVERYCPNRAYKVQADDLQNECSTHQVSSGGSRITRPYARLLETPAETQDGRRYTRIRDRRYRRAAANSRSRPCARKVPIRETTSFRPPLSNQPRRRAASVPNPRRYSPRPISTCSGCARRKSLP
jgi:hypothetical protein